MSMSYVITLPDEAPADDVQKVEQWMINRMVSFKPCIVPNGVHLTARCFTAVPLENFPDFYEQVSSILPEGWHIAPHSV